MSSIPTTVVELPSKGLLYPAHHPLRTGRLTLKHMTAREEDILDSRELIGKGIVLDTLFASMIMTPRVSTDDILGGDLNAVMVAARVVGIGQSYDVEVECQECGLEQRTSCDLTTLRHREGASDLQRTQDGHFVVRLPVSGRTIVFRLLTRGRERAMETELQSLRKLNGTAAGRVTAFLRHIVISVDGSIDKKAIFDCTENMLVKDSSLLRKEYVRAMPNVMFECELTCEGCEDKTIVPFGIGTDFFWPNQDQ